MTIKLQTYTQTDAYSSPWPLRRRCALLAWGYVWSITCRWTPKPFNRWRLFVLRCFGTEIHGAPFVHQRARIQQPWNLVLRDHACVGDRAAIYSLNRIELHERVTIAQEAYLCTGTHDFLQSHLPLQTAPIEIGVGAFVGARAFIMAGVTVGAGCIIGAMSVVTHDVPPGAIVAGNPARILGQRPVR